ncbi:unnamed protein product [Rotaria sp. Silwood2]|nr:unnamed protein product [Rotaria sp. Silwood2]CAF4566531.1 unnamed protein product [Rotaria sp. Silwood2]
MFSVEEDEVDEASNPLKENVVPQSVTNSDSSSLKNNSKFRTSSSSSSSSVAITKQSHGLELEKVSSLGSHNTNVNVGNNHSVFSLFNILIPRLIRGNCYCHVLHNSVKHGNNHLLFDVEAAILKIYSQFCRSSVRCQELGKYFEFVDQEQIVMKYI